MLNLPQKPERKAPPAEPTREGSRPLKVKALIAGSGWITATQRRIAPGCPTATPDLGALSATPHLGAPQRRIGSGPAHHDFAPGRTPAGHRSWARSSRHPPPACPA